MMKPWAVWTIILLLLAIVILLGGVIIQIEDLQTTMRLVDVACP